MGTEMNEYASVDDLTVDGEPTSEDVALSNGKCVQVRGISRFEWMLMGKRADGDGNMVETILLSTAIIQPPMTEKQVEAWRKRPGALQDIGKVSDAIRKLSGLGEGAQKSDVAEAGDPS